MGDGFDKKAIFLPFLRIFVNVLPNFAVILLTTDNMIVIGTLPKHLFVTMRGVGFELPDYFL